jgi:hypothetical protein
VGILTNLVDRVRAALGGLTPLTRQDRPLWANARTLDDLAKLTAQWLEGDIDSQPGYYGKVDVDEDIAPGLKDALVALNRAGFLTNSSQAGFDGEAWGGHYFEQLAAVEGFTDADTTQRLREALAGTEYETIVHDCKPSIWGRADAGVDVTYLDGQPHTTFGRQVGEFTIASTIYDGCGDEAIDALCESKQVTIYDPEIGRNEMWAVLREAADQLQREMAAANGDTDSQQDDAAPAPAQPAEPENVPTYTPTAHDTDTDEA